MIDTEEAVNLGARASVAEIKKAYEIYRADVVHWLDKQHIDATDATLFALSTVFHAGIVQGKRAERAKRKK